MGCQGAGLGLALDRPEGSCVWPLACLAHWGEVGRMGPAHFGPPETGLDSHSCAQLLLTALQPVWEAAGALWGHAGCAAAGGLWCFGPRFRGQPGQILC